MNANLQAIVDYVGPLARDLGASPEQIQIAIRFAAAVASAIDEHWDETKDVLKQLDTG